VRGSPEFAAYIARIHSEFQRFGVLRAD